MSYKIMRLRKYYDVFRTNNSLPKVSLGQKYKISKNIIRFFKNSAKKSHIIDNKPVVAQIEPTSECNLKCEMCIREKIGVPIGTMSLDNFKKILNKLDTLFKIHFSGQGEPFLNPKWYEMINYANKRGITVHTTSNGTLLTKNIIDKLCKLDIGEITISIDSPLKKRYEKIRKGASFERVLKNLKNLTENINEKKRNTIVSISAVILKENINELPEFIKMADSVGVKKVIFQTIQEKKDYMEKYNAKTKSQGVSSFGNKLKEKMKEAQKKAKGYGIILIFDEGKSSGCIWPWRSIYVNWEGNITPCCKILDYRNPFMGNILKKNFWGIWNGPSYQKFRHLLKNRKAPDPCQGCNMV